MKGPPLSPPAAHGSKNFSGKFQRLKIEPEQSMDRIIDKKLREVGAPSRPTLDEARAWFADWFDPGDESLANFLSYVRRVHQEVWLQKADNALKPADWEYAADVLLRDLPAVIREHNEICREFPIFGGPESYTAALAKLLIAVRDVRSIAGIPLTWKPKHWHFYANQFFFRIKMMAADANKRAGRSPTSPAISVTCKALIAVGAAQPGRASPADFEANLPNTVVVAIGRMQRKRNTKRS